MWVIREKKIISRHKNGWKRNAHFAFEEKETSTKCQPEIILAIQSCSVYFLLFSLTVETFTPQRPQPTIDHTQCIMTYPGKQCISFQSTFIGGQYNMVIRIFYPPSLSVKSFKERKCWKSLVLLNNQPLFIFSHHRRDYCALTSFFFFLRCFCTFVESKAPHQLRW